MACEYHPLQFYIAAQALLGEAFAAETFAWAVLCTTYVDTYPGVLSL
jgi:hypothetical protein